jgi:hypothetical protein
MSLRVVNRAGGTRLVEKVEAYRMVEAAITANRFSALSRDDSASHIGDHVDSISTLDVCLEYLKASNVLNLSVLLICTSTVSLCCCAIALPSAGRSSQCHVTILTIVRCA